MLSEKIYRGRSTFVMERPEECMSLRDYILQVERLDEKTAVGLLHRLVKSIAECIKPDNVLLDFKTNLAKIIDFSCGAVGIGAITEYCRTPKLTHPARNPQPLTPNGAKRPRMTNQNSENWTTMSNRNKKATYRRIGAEMMTDQKNAYK